MNWRNGHSAGIAVAMASIVGGFAVMVEEVSAHCSAFQQLPAGGSCGSADDSRIAVREGRESPSPRS